MAVALIDKLASAAVLPTSPFKMALPPVLLKLMLSQREAEALLLMVLLSFTVAVALLAFKLTSEPKVSVPL